MIKKIIFCLILLCCISPIAFAENTYYDNITNNGYYNEINTNIENNNSITNNTILDNDTVYITVILCDSPIDDFPTKNESNYFPYYEPIFPFYPDIDLNNTNFKTDIIFNNNLTIDHNQDFFKCDNKTLKNLINTLYNI